jgi:hypothetical protein
MKNQRSFGILVAVLLSGIAAGSSQAAGKAAAAKPNNSTPVTFTITSSQCASVPAGADIQASGVVTNITRTQPTGSALRQVITSHAYGTATDALGNTYVWSYSNQQNSTSSDGQTWTGSMVDHFSLTGNGPVHIVAGFTGSATYSATSLTITPDNVIGDPIDFDTITAHCDPL